MSTPRDPRRPTRLPEHASSDRAALDRLLDSALVGHFGLVAEDGTPVVIPTAVIRDGDRVLADDDDDKERVLDLVTERLLPGRVAEVRRPSKAELAATLVLALPLDDWSLKVSDGWPEDEQADIDGPAWAGVVPLSMSYDDPLAAPDLAAGIDVPPSVRGLTV